MQKSKKIKIQSLLLIGVLLLCFLGSAYKTLFSVKQIKACFSAWNGEPPTSLLATFSTYYSQTDKGRCENLSLAASRIDGVLLQPYGDFSFNQTVGKRTKTAGFRQAKVILNGEFVLGIGGGVCQVSTTLYNAAVLSGLSVTEFHNHSLPVSYVPPSCDAMVSSESDLKLFNTHSFPVKFFANAKNGVLTVSLYGQKIPEKYKLVSQTIGVIEADEPIVVYGDEERIVREAKQGIKSEGYLERYKNGVLLERKRIRKDTYAAQPAIVKKIADTTKKIG